MELNFKHLKGSSGSKKRFFVFAGVLVAAVVLAVGSLRWRQLKNDPALIQQAAFQEYQEKVEEAYRNDIYGGATPEETLRLFVEALKNEDIELASKYFALDDDLSGGSWSNSLEEIKKDGLLQQMVFDIETRANPDLDIRIDEGDYKFILLTDTGLVGAIINMELNPISKIWKIESL